MASSAKSPDPPATEADLLALTEQGRGYELIDGFLEPHDADEHAQDEPEDVHLLDERRPRIAPGPVVGLCHDPSMSRPRRRSTDAGLLRWRQTWGGVVDHGSNVIQIQTS